jgi:predicted permease
VALALLVQPVMRHLAADLRYALRTFRKAPLFAVIAIGSMAFGIAANTAVFTLVDQVVLRPLPVDDPGQLVQVSAPDTESYGGTMGDGSELSYAMYRDLRDHNEVFRGMFCRMPFEMSVAVGRQAELVPGELVSGTLFPQLGVRPALGRLLAADDERAPGDRAVAVLSHAYWRSRFGADAGIIGRTISISGHPFEVVGVVEPDFKGFDIGQPARVYVPISMQPQIGPAWLELETRRFRFVQVYGRLRDGVTAAGAQAALQPLFQSILQREAAEPEFATASADTKRRFLEGAVGVDDASRGRSRFRRSVSEPLLILMAVAAGVLLIVCANVANLLLARGAARHRGLALRLAVGASRLQIVRLLLVESLALAGAGAFAGLLLATWGAQFLLGFYATPGSEIAVGAEPDGRVLLFTMAVAVVTAVVAGLVPAFRSSRVDLAPTLKGSGGGVVAEQPTLRRTLVVAQVTLSFVLLCWAGLFVRSLQNLAAVDPGFVTDRVVTFRVPPAVADYDATRARAFADMLVQGIERTPGVSAAAYSFMPLLGGGGWGMSLTVEGYNPPSADEEPGAAINAVSPGYFRAMGIPLVAGRDFDERDGPVADAGTGWPYRAAIVNQTFAERYFKGANPIGRRLGFDTDPGSPTPIEIVGVARDSRYRRIKEDPHPQVFVPFRQARMETIAFYVRTAGDADAVMQSIRRAVAAIDPLVPIYEVSTLEDLISQSIVNERLIAALSTALSTMATLLAVVGLYGVMAYSVTRRTREIGIRMALGAVGRQIAAAVMREAGLLVAVGLALGLAGAWWLGRYAESQLYGVAPNDLATIVVAAAVLAAIGAFAAFFPARRASRVSPMTALRDE